MDEERTTEVLYLVGVCPSYDITVHVFLCPGQRELRQKDHLSRRTCVLVCKDKVAIDDLGLH